MSEAALEIGVDLGGTKALFVSAGQAMRFDTGPTFGPGDFVALLHGFVASMQVRPACIGIAVPGLVDDTGGIVACDVLPALTGWRPAPALRELGFDSVVLNDVKAALLEELHAAPPGLTAGVVMAGTAIGAAFVVDGTPLRGASGWAGELGYLPFVLADKVRRLDEVAGGAAMAARRGVAAARLAELARGGEEESLAIIEAGGSALGCGLAAVINLLNPAHLALGGGAIDLPGYREAAERTAGQHSIPALWNDCTVARVAAGDQVVARGALRAALARRTPRVTT